MSLRITSLDELQLLTCLKHGLWGAKNNRFSKWKVGEQLVFISNQRVAALAEISGQPFENDEAVWDNGRYPYRIPIKFMHVIAAEERPLTSEAITPYLRAGGHENVGFVMQIQLLIDGKPANDIVSQIKSKPNVLESTIRNLDELIVSAELLRRKKNEQASEASNQENPKASRYWLIAAGPRGEQWDSFEKEQIVAIAYDQIQGNLKGFKNRLELKRAFEAFNPEKTPTHDPLACWEFANEMRMGDFVIAKEGRECLLGFGVIKSHYEYEPHRGPYKHIRKVEWLTTGRWNLPNTMNLLVTKALTDITKYSGFPDELLNVMGIETPHQQRVSQRFWWMYCNPAIWNISDHPQGSKHTYTTHNKSGNKRFIYKHFQTVRPGDLVVSYVSTPVQQVRAICQITKELFLDDGVEKIEFEKILELGNPVSLEVLSKDPVMANAENMRNSQGSLFQLTQEEFSEILSLAKTSMDDIRAAKSEPIQPQPALFIEPSYFQEIADMLKHKKNVVLQGPPGVGKTFIAKLLAQSFVGDCANYIETVQFHQSYSYEDFIRGYKPNSTGGFALEEGIFYRFCEKAIAEPKKDFFFIIDEINRGNLSKIFGELMMLIEGDKRGDKHSIPLAYSKTGERFFIPKNLHLIGTMNTADRSLAMVDYALRRRFAFFSISPQFESKAFSDYLTRSGVEKNLIEQIISRMTLLNKEITEDKRRLGEGFRIGHSFFCRVDESADKSWYERIIKYEIAPLIREYWFDDEEKAHQAIELLLSDSPFQSKIVA